MMMQPPSDWDEVPLGAVVNLKRGYDLPSKERRDGVVPIVSSSGITGFQDEVKVTPPGVVTGRYGTLGQVFFIQEGFWPLNTTLYVQDFKGNDPRWVSYLLSVLRFGERSGAAAVPGLNRNALHQLPVLRPPVRTQQKVASVLSTYDSLIENNTRRIQILEEMAEAIHREWFVEFRYPGHEEEDLVETDPGPIPNGWERKPLFIVAEPTFGFPFKSELFRSSGDGMPVIRIRDIPPNRTETLTSEKASAKYVVENGDLLVGMDGDFHMGRWAGGRSYLNQRVVRFRPIGDSLSRYHLFLELRRPIRTLNQSIVGTTVAHLGKRHLEQINVVVPSPRIRGLAQEVFDPLFDQQLTLHEATKNLASTRDLLLPRLISGEVDVSDLDIQTSGLVA